MMDILRKFLSTVEPDGEAEAEGDKLPGQTDLALELKKTKQKMKDDKKIFVICLILTTFTSFFIGMNSSDKIRGREYIKVRQEIPIPLPVSELTPVSADRPQPQTPVRNPITRNRMIPARVIPAQSAPALQNESSDSEITYRVIPSLKEEE